MKTRILLVLCSCVLLGSTSKVGAQDHRQGAGHNHSSTPLQSPSLTTTPTQNLDQVLSSYYKAIGGAEKFSAVHACRVAGRFVSADGSWKKRYTVQVKDTKIKVEMDIQAGMKMVQAFDGTNGWTIMPWSGSLDPQPMNAENRQALALRVDMFRNDLIVYRETGTKLTVLPNEEIDGSDCIKILAQRADGVSKEYFLDVDSYLIVKVVTKYRLNDEDIEDEHYYSNYRTFDGMLVPFASENKGGGGMYFDSFELNPNIDDTVFTMPKKG